MHPDFIVNATPIGADRVFIAPTVATLPDGHFLVTWESQDGGDGSGSLIRARFFDANGTALGGDFAVNTTASNEQLDPTAVALPDGHFVVTWQSFDGGDGSGTLIRARLFTANGTPSGNDFIVNSTTANDQFNPRIAALPDGHFVVTWTSRDVGNSIRGRLFNADGSAVGNDFLVNADGSGCDVSALPDGHFVVTWFLPDNGGDIRARLFNSNGTPVAGDFGVNSTIANLQVSPTVTALPDGHFVVTWYSYDGGDGSGTLVRGRLFNANGTAVGNDFIVNTTTANDQFFPAVAALTDGDFVVTWSSEDGVIGSRTFIRARVFGPDATPVGTDFIVNATPTAINGSLFPSVTKLPDSHFAIAWQSDDGGNVSLSGVRASIFDAHNQPPIPTPDVASLIWHIATTGNVLVNDSDPNAGDSLLVAQFAFGATSAVAGSTLAGTYGTLTVQADGSFKYIATRGNLTLGQSATDHFTYTVSDSLGATATASLDFKVTDTALSELIGTQTSHLGGSTGELVRLYDAALDRVADERGLVGWVNGFKGGIPLNQVANSFATSTEFLTKYGSLDNAGFIARLYQNALGRSIDADPSTPGIQPTAESQPWIAALNQGTVDRGAVLLGISDSVEHIADTQVSPLTDGFAPNENASAVGRLYYGLLNRPADAPGLLAFGTAVENGTPLKQVAQAILSSDEFTFKFPALSNHDYVDHLYQDALSRDADNDPAGQSYTDALTLGVLTRADLAIAIAESLEAKDHLAPFIEKGFILA